MKNKDFITKEKEKIILQIQSAIKEGNTDKFSQSLGDLAQQIHDSIIEEASIVTLESDNVVLAQRNVRTLTSAEQKFYTEVIDAMGSSDPKQALTGAGLTVPDTVFESVFEDIGTVHKIFQYIKLNYTSGNVKLFINKTGVQLAAFGSLTSSYTKEVTAAIKEIDSGLYKLSAFLPISKSMLKLGAQWLDRYVREVLTESIAAALESAIVDGDGNGKLIGMTRSVADDVTITGGVYPRKEAVEVTEITPESYGELVAILAEDANEKPRTFEKVVLFVSLKDYLTKIMPATIYRATDGSYVRDIFPFPTDVCPCIGVPDGYAILGLPGRYFLSVSLSDTKGKIEYDDSVQFIEDNRVYGIKLYTTGLPKDDSSFLLLDISGLSSGGSEDDDDDENEEENPDGNNGGSNLDGNGDGGEELEDED